MNSREPHRDPLHEIALVIFLVEHPRERRRHSLALIRPPLVLRLRGASRRYSQHERTRESARPSPPARHAGHPPQSKRTLSTRPITPAPLRHRSAPTRTAPPSERSKGSTARDASSPALRNRHEGGEALRRPTERSAP